MNGLRGVAALAVMTTHVWDFATPDALGRVNGAGRIDVGLLHPVFAAFGLGVALFFTLSGFLLYRRFAASILGVAKRPSVRDYAWARVLRIVPLYWAILLITGVFFSAALLRTSNGALAFGSLASQPRALLADLTFTQNYVPSTVLTGIGPTWTLLDEAVFYVVLPLLALPLLSLASRRRSRPARLALALAAPVFLLMLGLASKGYGQVALALTPDGGWHADWRSVFQRSFLYQADLFAAGMAAAVLSVAVEHGSLRISWRVRRALVFAAAAIFLVIPVLGRHGAYPPILVETTVSFSFGLLLLGLATVGGRRSLLAQTLQWRPIALVGAASYSLFLWHEPVIRWLNAHGATTGGRGGLALNILLVAAISLSLTTLSYRVVERPFLALRKRRERRRALAGATETAPAAGLTAAAAARADAA
jgi:peptidoglycan/LPS O-acetylase OafA/YrhL